MAAAGAAEVPVLSYIAIGLLAALAFVVLVGLRYTWDYTLGMLLNALASVTIPIPLASDIHPLGFLRAFDHRMRNEMLKAAQKSEAAMGYFFHGAAVIQGWAARELLGLAQDVYQWGAWLQHSHLPRWAKALVYAALPPALLARLVKAAIDARLPHLIRTTVIHSTHSITHTVTRIIHATAGAVALPGWVIRVPHRLRDLERDRTHLWRRLRSLEKYAGAAGAVALFTAAIARLGLKWIRCRNVSRVGRRVCAMDTSLLDTLLADGLLLIGTLSVVEFAHALLDVEETALGIIARGVDEWPG